METYALINGNIVNEFDEIVGTYHYIIGNLYRLKLYGNSEEIIRDKMVEKVKNLELYFEPIWG